MSLPETNVDLIISKAKEIIQQAQAALDSGREMINSTGLNTAVDVPKMNRLLSFEQKKMLQKMIDSDNEDIQKEVDSEKSRLQINSKYSGNVSRKNRKII
jgi:hypothetical protein